MLRFTSVFLLIIAHIFVKAQSFEELHPEVNIYADSINNLKSSFEIISLNNEEFMESMTDGGGKLTGYFIENEIIKIELWAGQSYGTLEYTYYFKGSELYYVTEAFYQFEYDLESNKMDYSKKQQTYKGDYLFDTMFDYASIGHNRFENDQIDPEKALSEEAEKYSVLLKQKRESKQ